MSPMAKIDGVLSLEFLGVHGNQVLVEIETEIGDRPELHGETEERQQRIGRELGQRAVLPLDDDRFELAAVALQIAMAGRART